ncbi:hypothetical protein BV20DRAFT_1063452, partial [Pilatotrama ljubarskyi]
MYLFLRLFWTLLLALLILGEDDSGSDLVPAFREVPSVRLAYMQGVFGNIFDHQTVRASQRVIRTVLDAVELVGMLPAHPKPARTLQTAGRRLGLHLDDYITQIPVCTHCWKPYTLEELASLEAPSCTVPRCPGIVYKVNLKRRREEDILHEGHNNGGGPNIPGAGSCDSTAQRRVPAKIQPWYSLVTGLRRYLLRPDFVDNLVDMSDHVDPPPLNDDTPMHDIYDGSRFGQLPMGLKRVIDADGAVRDVEISP